jgi:hypothetical protein
MRSPDLYTTLPGRTGKAQVRNAGLLLKGEERSVVSDVLLFCAEREKARGREGGREGGSGRASEEARGWRE